eukprot:TRINITY_DN4097_c0_g1_i1.p1 TRINITY_DN4097_c0_g1~~TRINITY_DN4097_c0_g1_i1.p1  ORF type:complete len:309 (+),score=77.64 TRINITY_DN4097_c0_g1_i1:40-966(+)
MVLMVNGTLIQSVKDPEVFLRSYSGFRRGVEEFLSQKERQFNESDGYVYVSQNEFAVASSESTVDKHGLHYLGSDEATTCVILVASNETHVGLAHLDRCEPGGLRSFIDRIGGGKEFTLDIVGGFQDPKETSQKLILSLLKALIAFPEVFTLRTTCVGGFNTQMKKGIPWPRVYGVAVDIRKREVLPGSFNFHGPARVLRHIRLSFSREKRGIQEVFDPESGNLRVEPFSYEPLSQDYAQGLCSLPPKTLIEYISTSPEVEKDSFLPHFLECVDFIQRHPDPVRSNVFPCNKALLFTFMNGAWRLREQ